VSHRLLKRGRCKRILGSCIFHRTRTICCSMLQCVAVRCSVLQCVVNPRQLHFPSHTNSPQAPHSYHCLNSQKVSAIDMYMLKCLASRPLRISTDPIQHTLFNTPCVITYHSMYTLLNTYNSWPRTLRILADPIQQTLPCVLTRHSVYALLNTYNSWPDEL